MKKIILLTLTIFILNSTLVLATTKSLHQAKTKADQCYRMPHHTSVTFDQLKSLSGSWSGTKNEANGKKSPVRVTYKTTAGGSALLETLFPQTKMEMISVYALQDKKIRMTHYCMMGNQPNMILDSSTANTLHFKYVKSPGICSCKDSYMGALTMTFKNKNHMNQEWVMFEKGEKKMTAVLELTRGK